MRCNMRGRIAFCMPSSMPTWRKECEIGHTMETYTGCGMGRDSKLNRKKNVNGVRASNDDIHDAVTVIGKSPNDSALEGLSPNEMTRGAIVAMYIGREASGATNQWPVFHLIGGRWLMCG